MGKMAPNAKRASLALYTLAGFNAILAVASCIAIQKITITSTLIALCAFAEYAWALVIDHGSRECKVLHLQEEESYF
jgi:hypothetical protein